jgi:hypothetical protein
MASVLKQTQLLRTFFDDFLIQLCPHPELVGDQRQFPRRQVAVTELIRLA